jgi:hypothetical protein
MARHFVRGSGFSVLVALSGLCCAGCSGNAASALDVGGSAGASADSRSEGHSAAIPDALSFEVGDTLRLAPAQRVPLVVHATPPGRYRIRFALPTDAKDASLDHSEAMSDEDGAATVNLTAPTSASLFTVRASVGTEVKTEVDVSVSELGYATLRLKPVYAGLRRIAGWVASVHPDADCASLQGVPYTDGSLVTKVGSNDTAILEDVPIGQPFAATLRSAQLAGGCIETGKLPAGTVTQLDVPILDRPMQLADLKLGLDIGVDTSSKAWVDAMKVGVEPAVAALRGTAKSDLEAFIDALQEIVAPELSVALSEARAGGEWDSALSNALDFDSTHAPLSDRVRQWLEAAADATAAPKVITAVLLAGSTEDAPSELELVSVGGVAPSAAGFARTNDASITADPGDVLLFATSLYWLPSQLLTELAARLLAEQSPGVTPATALAEKLDCSKAADYLSSDKVFKAVACGKSCAEDLCQQAMECLWTRVRNYSAAILRPAQLELSATTTVDFDDEARPRGVEGTWIGTVIQGDNTVSVKGSATGTAVE